MPIEKCLENYFQGILYTNFIYYIKIKLVKYTLKVIKSITYIAPSFEKRDAKYLGKSIM